MKISDKTKICIIGSITGELSDETVKEIIKSISVIDNFDLITGSKRINRLGDKGNKAYVVLGRRAEIKNSIERWKDEAIFFPAWINDKGEFLVNQEIKKKLG